LKAGIAPLQASGGAPLTVRDIDRLKCERGEVPPPRQWFFGFREILRRFEAELGPDVVWMSHPSAIITSFDKLDCLQRWTRAGLPVPPRYPEIADYAGLREQVRDRHARLFIKLRYGYSAVGAVALEWRGDLIRAITTVEVDWSGSRPRLFLSRHPRLLTSESDIARLIDLLGHEEVLVESWLPKARLNGVPFDLRLVVIGGTLRHVVGRANSSPFTNLNLDACRIPREAVEHHLGKSWSTAQELAERAAAELPEALVLGIDLLVRPSFQRFALLEANAFGDYLPGLFHRGESTYEAALRAIASMAEEPV
jgi:hypothetical protein